MAMVPVTSLSHAPPHAPSTLHPARIETLEADAIAVRMLRSRGAIGETLLRLFDGDRLMQLGYSRQKDHSHERLGVPARTMSVWLRLARDLAPRPVLRRAVVAGAVSPRKALTIAPLAHGDQEERWTAAAMNWALQAHEQAVGSGGAGPPSDVFEFESFVLRMRVWLERKMRALPELREALSDGRLTFAKARLIAGDAGSGDAGLKDTGSRDTGSGTLASRTLASRTPAPSTWPSGSRRRSPPGPPLGDRSRRRAAEVGVRADRRTRHVP